MELSTFYRHIYLNLPGFTRLVGVAGVGAPLSFGVFPALRVCGQWLLGIA